MPVYGLSSQTAKSINGSSPYLSFDNGKSASSTILPLLSITLPKNKVISALEDNSSATDPIMIDKVSSTFSDIVTNMPFANYPSTTLANVVVTNNYWHDPDGDKLFTITGNMQIKWENAAGEDVTNYVKSNPNSELDTCKSPYKLTLSADAGSLATNYGIPSIGSFTGGSHSYYLYPSTPKVCYVKPSLAYGRHFNDEGLGGEIAGPPNIWNPDHGFLVQSITPESYGINFPTTGADNLYFDLDISGTGALNWPVVTHGGITATMIPNSSGTSVRVTLTGPVASEAQKQALTPGIIPKPNLPATFELVGKDNQGKEVIKYGFVLKQWFVNRGQNKVNYDNAKTWCDSIGYQLPTVKDLTNGYCPFPDDPTCQSAVPTSDFSPYQRYIGASFLAEWGKMGNYPNADFNNSETCLYWTRDRGQSDSYYRVFFDDGVIYAFGGHLSVYSVCVAP
ncbi:hypothetical protein [Gilliamella sp. wkB171]|uniref:hypothetical protein n=1 Tax=Gilliamella sp. wkB171 TaxID=3120258 RepID=UPI00081307D2|nr:hypothetical protein [Gilliamella apicola]OCL19596.1 hypothetical protein A9G03_07745 [Gilliamella apicola]